MCDVCSIPDTTEHVLNQCVLHEKERTTLLKEFSYAQQVSSLLTSQEKNTMDKLTDFLVQIEYTRINLAKEADAQITDSQNKTTPPQ